MRLGRRFAALRLHDLRFVFGATVVSELGDGVVGVALAFAVLDLTHSATDLGIVVASRTVAQVSALLIGGVIADRTSRRTVMMGADAIRCGGQVLIGALLISHHATVVEIALSQALLGAAGGFFNPASAGLIPAVAGEHLQEANALQGIGMAASNIIGPAIGGVLVVGVGAPWAMVVDGASYLGSALLLSRVHSPGLSAAAGDPDASFLRELRGGFHEVRSRTWVWSLIMTFAVGNALIGTFQVLGPLMSREHYGGAAAWALLGTVWAVGSLLGGVVVLRFKPKAPLRAGVLMCLPFALPSILMALRMPLLVLVPFQLLAGIGPIGFNTLWWTALQQHVPAEAISRVISFDFAGSFALQPIGYLLAGPVAVWLGLAPAMIVFSSTAFLAFFSNLLVRDVHTLRASPAGAAPAEASA